MCIEILYNSYITKAFYTGWYSRKCEKGANKRVGAHRGQIRRLRKQAMMNPEWRCCAPSLAPTMTYPRDWNALRQAVRIRDEKCMNCRRSPAGTEGLPFDTHHVVPLGWGGSNRMSNLILLCRDCHDAAHGHSMAPVMRSYSNGSMSSDEFELYKSYWESHDLARFNGDERYWYIPAADVEYLTNEIDIEPTRLPSAS